jgi:hypothetical protein
MMTERGGMLTSPGLDELGGARLELAVPQEMMKEGRQSMMSMFRELQAPMQAG